MPLGQALCALCSIHVHQTGRKRTACASKMHNLGYTHRFSARGTQVLPHSSARGQFRLHALDGGSRNQGFTARMATLRLIREVLVKQLTLEGGPAGRFCRARFFLAARHSLIGAKANRPKVPGKMQGLGSQQADALRMSAKITVNFWASRRAVPFSMSFRNATRALNAASWFHRSEVSVLLTLGNHQTSDRIFRQWPVSRE